MAIVHLGNVLQGTAYASGLDTRIPWSALEYSGGTQVITGISGSAIGGVGGGIDSATVSAIASAYVESGVSGKMDSSASSQFQPSGDYAYNSSLTGYQPTGDYAYNSSLSSKLDASASSQFQPSGDYYSATNPSGFVGSSYVESSVSGKQDASAMSAYALSSDVSGVIDTVSSNSASWSATGGDVYTSGFGYNDSAISSIEESSLYDASAHARIFTLSTRISNVSAAVSGKMDASASSSFVPISAVSSWSSDIQALSAALSAIQTAMANVYTLSAGSGIQISSNTSTKVTVVQLS